MISNNGLSSWLFCTHLRDYTVKQAHPMDMPVSLHLCSRRRPRRRLVNSISAVDGPGSVIEPGPSRHPALSFLFHAQRSFLIPARHISRQIPRLCQDLSFCSRTILPPVPLPPAPL